jgi:hypothetical protein
MTTSSSGSEILQERLGMKFIRRFNRKTPGGQNRAMAEVMCSCGKPFITALSLWRNCKIDKCSACGRRAAKRAWY